MFPETHQSAAEGYRFGQYEIWPRSGLLLRDGKRVRVEELPLQFLLVLLESPGEVVPKATLLHRLWGDRVFGERDNGLHVAAAKLREALGEKAGAAQHIETVRGRGYRFLGEVEPLPAASDSISASPAGVGMRLVGAEEAAGAALAAVPPQVDGGPARGRPSFYLQAGILLGLLMLGATVFLFRRPTGLSGSSNEVVLGGFTNSSGDDSYSGLEHALRIKLEESPYLNLAPPPGPDSGPQQKLSNQPASAALAAQLKGCVAVGGKVLITGDIAPRSAGFAVTTAAHRCNDGRLLDAETVRADDRGSVLAALDQAADRLRGRLGEPAASLERFHVPVEQATTTSLAALRAFTLGDERRDRGQEFQAIEDYKLAVDLDPQFALAYARLGTIYSNAAELTQSARYFQKAFDLRERTTDRERLYIAAHYYSISGQTQRTIEAYQLWRSIYPRDASPSQNLAYEYLSLGQPEKAVDAARTAVQLDSASSLSEAVLARAYLETGAKAQLRELCRQAEGGRSDSAMLHESCFLLAFEQNDGALMERQTAWSRGNAAKSELLDDVAWVAMYQGRLASAGTLFAEARQTALAQGFSELAATVDADQAILEADLGSPEKARGLAREALRLAPSNVSIAAQAALALARSGETVMAESIAARAAAQQPLDTILNDAELPTIRAAIELQKHHGQAAVAALEVVRPYDNCSALALVPGYYRGLAYEQSAEMQKAVTEYRQVLTHRAMAPDSPYVPLAAWQLGRLLRQMNDPSGAAAAEQAAEQAWQHADPGFKAPGR